MRQIRFSEDYTQHVIEIMRKTNCQHTEAVQRLAGDRLLMAVLDIRDVEDSSNVADVDRTNEASRCSAPSGIIRPCGASGTQSGSCVQQWRRES